MTGCDHKFVGSKRCLKCGWAPPPRNFRTPEEVAKSRAKGGKKGSRLREVSNRLEKVFAEMDEEQEP